MVVPSKLRERRNHHVDEFGAHDALQRQNRNVGQFDLGCQEKRTSRCNSPSLNVKTNQRV